VRGNAGVVEGREIQLPQQNRQLVVHYYWWKYQVDGFCGAVDILKVDKCIVWDKSAWQRRWGGRPKRTATGTSSTTRYSPSFATKYSPSRSSTTRYSPSDHLQRGTLHLGLLARGQHLPRGTPHLDISYQEVLPIFYHEVLPTFYQEVLPISSTTRYSLSWHLTSRGIPHLGLLPGGTPHLDSSHEELPISL